MLGVVEAKNKQAGHLIRWLMFLYFMAKLSAVLWVCLLDKIKLIHDKTTTESKANKLIYSVHLILFLYLAIFIKNAH